MNGEEFIDKHYEEALEMIRRFAPIPAPSHKEGMRVEEIMKWLREEGMEGYVDEALNVIIPYNADKDEIDVLAAHTDIVFPDLEPLPFCESEDLMACPGIGDDTANFVFLLLLSRQVIRSGIDTRRGILFVCNSCEEGEGNLKGTRELFRSHGKRISSFTSFDCDLGKLVTGAVGSHRYRIDIRTEGGHSYSAFGKRNAIREMADLTMKLDAIKLPPIGRTTYNFGTIEGGTGINVIASSSSLLYEYRSDLSGNLEYMKSEFERVVEEKREEGIQIEVKTIGNRPSGADVDSSRLIEIARRSLEKRGVKVSETPSSTDCNIPLSLGIPAVAFGVVRDIKAHTRDEMIIPSTLKAGCAAAYDYAMDLILRGW